MSPLTVVHSLDSFGAVAKSNKDLPRTVSSQERIAKGGAETAGVRWTLPHAVQVCHEA